MMTKVLYETARVGQRLVSVEPSGGAGEGGSVLWDERVDGQFPEDLIASVGGLVRQGRVLVVDAQKLAAHQAALAAKASAESARATRVAQAKAFLGGLDFSSNLTAAQSTNAIRAICVLFRDVYSQIN